VRPGGGGTLIVDGSHGLIESYYASLSPTDLARPHKFQRQELLRISPFLESGERGRGESAAVFGGSMSRAWDFLGTAERREVVLSIGSDLAAKGVTRVWLLNADGHVTAIYSNGELNSLTPRADEAEGDETRGDEAQGDEL
jgi:hypothetical protein